MTQTTESNTSMSKPSTSKTSAPDERTPARDLPPAARRALAEAEERRRLADAAAAQQRPKEIAGRGGAEPVRYGDWEVKGLASDF